MSTAPIPYASIKLSTSALEKLKVLEGYSSTPYWDYKQWSIGYGSYAGSTDRTKRPVINITKDHAAKLLIKQVESFEAQLKPLLKVALTPPQWDAVVLFIYNLGTGILTKPSATYGVNLLHDLNTKNFSRFAERMKRYIYAGGIVNEDLVKRRIYESSLFAGATAAGFGLAGILLFFSSLMS